MKLRVLAGVLLWAEVAAAQVPAETGPHKPPPYSLPWQLRPAAPASVVRSDSVLASYSDASGASGSTVVTMLLASYKLGRLAPLVRLGLVSSAPPGASGAAALINPAVGATYGIDLGDQMRLALFLGVALPFGMGGGNTPDPAQAAAVRAGIWARSAMDNAMFAVNDLTVFPGVDFAFVRAGFTVQAEVTLLQLTRVRGESVQPDASRTNFTAGVHAGYFLHPLVSIGGELRYQRWLSTPAVVASNPALRDTLTAALGARGHFKLSDSSWFRPGLAYARGLDDPLAGQGYNIVQLDLPVSF